MITKRTFCINVYKNLVTTYYDNYDLLNAKFGKHQIQNGYIVTSTYTQTFV